MKNEGTYVIPTITDTADYQKPLHTVPTEKYQLKSNLLAVLHASGATPRTPPLSLTQCQYQKCLFYYSLKTQFGLIYQNSFKKHFTL